jgi:hypothetical protein
MWGASLKKSLMIVRPVIKNTLSEGSEIGIHRNH